MDCNVLFHALVLLVVIREAKGGYQWTSWSRPSSCSAKCGQGIISRTRECKPTDNGVKTNRIDDDNTYCKGPATIEETCYLRPCNSIGSSGTCNCGCKLTSSEGLISSIHSQNSNILCRWYIETKPGSSITLKINRAENFDWTKGGIYVSGNDKVHKFTAQYGSRMLHSLPIVIKSTSNQLNMTIHYINVPNKEKLLAVAASYTTDFTPVKNSQRRNDDGDNSSDITRNIPAMAGIAACALIIIIAAIVVVCRRVHQKQNDEKNGDNSLENPEEGFEDNCSSISGSQRSAKMKHSANMSLISGQNGGYPVSPSSGCRVDEEHANLLYPPYSSGTLTSRGGYPDGYTDGYTDGNDVFVHAIPTTGTYIPGQTYNNWSTDQQQQQALQYQHPQYQPQQIPQFQQTQYQPALQIQQLPKAAIDFMINQAQLSLARQMTLDQHSKAGSSYYPTSEGET